MVAAAVSFALLPAGGAAGTSQDPVAGVVDAAECKKDPALISCRPDASVEADLARLRHLVREQFAPFGGEAMDPSQVEITFIGKGRTADISATESAAEGDAGAGRTSGKARAMNTWRLFNAATQNEFELRTSASVRETFDALVQRSDPRPNTGASPSPDGPTPGFRATDLSGGVDDRVRRTDNDTYPWRTIANMGNCTANFIGPRHIVTAGHCIYFRGSAATATQPAQPPAWTGNFTVQPQRDATNIPFSTAMPPAAGQDGWYFTPSGWRDPNLSGTAARQFDFGIVVVPDRLGDQVSWMGYGTLAGGDMLNTSFNLRGYPLCETETGTAPNNPERIDEPVVAGQPAPDFGCVINGFYAGSSCTVGSLSVLDPDGWNRRATHACDASAANSGSAVYMYFPGDPVPMVVGVHTTSTKCRFAGDAPCTAADTHPLQMTRITPEYRGWISYFRKLFP